MLEVKKTAKAAALPEKWPSSLYARPRVPAASEIPNGETYIAEEILDGCRTAVQQLQVDGPTSLGVTSSLRGEGRTTIALGLALALAEFGHPTVLVELDLVHPQLSKRISAARYPGLADIVEGRATLGDCLQPIGTNLQLVPAGQVHGSIPHALSLLAHADVFAEITSQGSMVVADLPPLLGSSIGRQAAGLTAEIVLVVRAGVAPARRIREAVAGLTAPPKVILNGTHTRVPDWAVRLAGV
jgi:tyrosine-protein kinase